MKSDMPLLRSPAPAAAYRSSAWMLGYLLLMAPAACSRQDVYKQLSEQQANQAVAVLQSAGIDARKEEREKGQSAVSAPSERLIEAVNLLHSHGLPQAGFESMGQVFKKEGLVSTPIEERARLNHALSQELAQTLQAIDGVSMARVHIAVPDRPPLSEKSLPGSASVFIKHRPERDFSGQVGQIKALVVNGVEGLTYDHVSVALFVAGPPPASTGQARTAAWPAKWAMTAAWALGASIFGASGAWAWWRMKRTESAKPSFGDSLQERAHA